MTNKNKVKVVDRSGSAVLLEERDTYGRVYTLKAGNGSILGRVQDYGDAMYLTVPFTHDGKQLQFSVRKPKLPMERTVGGFLKAVPHLVEGKDVEREAEKFGGLDAVLKSLKSYEC